MSMHNTPTVFDSVIVGDCFDSPKQRKAFEAKYAHLPDADYAEQFVRQQLAEARKLDYPLGEWTPLGDCTTFREAANVVLEVETWPEAKGFQFQASGRSVYAKWWGWMQSARYQRMRFAAIQPPVK